MTGWAEAAAGVVAAVVAGAVPSSVLFTFADREIAESSGLVDAGRVVFTVNDSGSGPLLYGVDTMTGETISRTTYTSDEVVDVEALAPAPGGGVWVGDIGDNGASRDVVSVYRVRPGADSSTRLDLRYPGGPRDAEALLSHPRTGRLFVVSKTVFGGTVYAVPRGARPGSPVTMRPFARVPGLVTDGAFLPDGKHVVLRGYGSATVLSFPDFQVQGSVELPEQRQGEAVAVGRRGRVLLSTEGVGTDVLQIELPPDLTAAPSASSTPAPQEPTRAAAPSDDNEEKPRLERRGMWSSPLGAAARVAMGVVMLGALGYWWWRLRGR